MNLVVGATGLLGSEICRQLAAKGKPVRALVRSTSDPHKVAQLKNLGITTVQGDLKDRASLDTACKGITTVISTASSTFSRQEGDSIESVDLQGQLNLVAAAKAAKVGQFVLISFPPIAAEFPLQTAKRTVEAALIDSGLTYTIWQPTYFMEVWLGPAVGFDTANAKAQIYGSGEKKISWISSKDVANFAVTSLDMAAARNAVIELGGPEALSPLEVVKIFETVQNRKFDVQHVPEEALREQRKTATDSLQQSFAVLVLSYTEGKVIDMKQTLETFPVRLTSVKDYARASLAASAPVAS